MSPRVLLVDDERPFVDALAARLALRGLETCAVYDGAQAMERLRAQDFDVVVLDIQLPDLSGLELIAEVHRVQPLAQVLLLTGQASLDTAVAGMKQGALDYLVKPVDIEALAAAIRSAGERRLVQEESRRMIEAGKMVALGQLARGVAHEINNPVNNMVTAAEWMLDLLGDEDPAGCRNLEELQRSAGVVRDNGRRCKDITLRLLTYCGAGDPRARDLDLGALLEDIAGRLAERAGKQGVEVALRVSPDLPLILVPAADLDEALSALADNALDAMEQRGGKLTLAARAEPDSVLVEVADTGVGVPAERIPHIFDPFFSTKDPGKGAGLGLAICSRVAHGLGGTLSVASQEGQGSVFSLRLPLSAGAASL